MGNRKNPSLLTRMSNPENVGRAAEKHQAKRLGARATPASGALAGAKGDMTLENFRIETKATNAVSYRLNLDDLLKIQQEALEQSQVPAFSVQFVMGNGRPKRNGSWVMIPESVFRELVIENSEGDQG